jgi:hypothetical protein
MAHCRAVRATTPRERALPTAPERESQPGRAGAAWYDRQIARRGVNGWKRLGRTEARSLALHLPPQTVHHLAHAQVAGNAQRQGREQKRRGRSVIRMPA